ncbi:class IIb bacteriocin, lactobin A/cerein 7B family [Pseudoalteromonas sp. JC28]|uniref:class IIb bacteriocin, lactobin A/cerein 7B family n=1 Tax=Pseudoalteromonas TaxID=53246 RepID=UPI0002F6D722|nr:MULTISPECIES: class IIb bacteriocin, lactobin A/cerein 7B family [Pseudoalteromonas]MCF2828709.1 class IIb bacteriocin, lactobin A/cerein 7B family [Pseudoalteromonas sp. OF5H-5]MCF2834483.1 class IIb bacteriocin, lactobin A/cerein 7B family [Pseudoalteromonas sp. DL2-H6]MCF2925119.1 class IIb bacteriocin, lactobin A/cerein 7B family [Pseudoalteromonas sp. DL2-H1]MCG7554084.1 class IIb bacteriocin, lactobin A/cerein 7B family [Pseudoalteromonas sp. Of11M-6]NSY34766.1 class IIb bacteriocin, 
MKEINKCEIQEVNGGVVPLFFAVAVYGEVAAFSAIVSGIATYNAVRSGFKK